MPLLLPLFGCPPQTGQITDTPPPSVAEPRELSEIVQAVNDNAERLTQALWSNSVHVTARFLDRKGKEHIYTFDGSLLFKRPRYLRMDLRHGLGTPVMQVGSNDEFYWCWIEPEMEQMWWGRHVYAGKSCVKSVTVRPEQMVAALGIGGLPPVDDDLIGPLRSFGREFDILYYAAPDDEHGRRFVRQYYIDRAPPHQIRLIAFLDRFGRKEMTAYLDDYKPAWEGGPWVAHAVSIFWPKDESKFTITMDRAAGRSEDQVSDKAFLLPTPEQLPAAVRRNVEQLDADCDRLDRLRLEANETGLGDGTPTDTDGPASDADDAATNVDDDANDDAQSDDGRPIE